MFYNDLRKKTDEAVIETMRCDFECGSDAITRSECLTDLRDNISNNLHIDMDPSVDGDSMLSVRLGRQNSRDSVGLGRQNSRDSVGGSEESDLRSVTIARFVNFLASRDKYVREANVLTLPSASVA